MHAFNSQFRTRRISDIQSLNEIESFWKKDEYYTPDKFTERFGTEFDEHWSWDRW